MHPILFEFKDVTIYSYAFFIAFGCLVAAIYTKREAKKKLQKEIPNSFFYSLFAMGFIGGKLFTFFEKPLYYIQNPGNISEMFTGGFVFYGSFVCIILMLFWYLKKLQIPLLQMLDILAITTTIVHTIGRVGCFFAGCCYGKPTSSVFGMVFPTTNNIAVHPTQLYEVFTILFIMAILFQLKKNKKFNGQIFISYVILYAIARSILEVFRGDKRGFIFTDILSHSQFIALLLISIASYFYFKLNKKLTI